MDFAIKLLLSFLVGGAYVSVVIWLSEKVGSRIGSAVAGLPSTILVGAAFIDVTEGSAVTQAAVSLVPLMFLATLVYGLVFLRTAETKNEPMAVLVATLAWLVTAVFFRFGFKSVDFLLVTAVGVAGLVVCEYLFRNFAGAAPKKIALPQSIYLFRFVVSGLLISGSVLAAREAGAVWGGIISCFPALLGSVLYFMSKTQGEVFLKGFIRRLPLSYFSSLIFLVIIYETVTKISDGLSFTLALCGAVAYTALLILFKRASGRI